MCVCLLNTRVYTRKELFCAKSIRTYKYQNLNVFERNMLNKNFTEEV